jgi:hypothetical protein
MLTPHNTCARRMLFGDAAAVKGKRDFNTAGDNIQRLRTGENKPQMLVSRDVTGGLSEVQRKVSFMVCLGTLSHLTNCNFDSCSW